MLRRRFMASASAIALAGARSANLSAETSAQPGSPVPRGREFLASLFDAELGLLPEYRGAKTYWLFHDNYLAAKVLANSQPDIARRIAATMRELGVGESGKIEIIFGEAKNPLPFRNYSLDVVKQEGERVIKTERVVGGELSGWEVYADLLLLAAIAEAASAPERARQRLGAAMAMWDGKGFKDRVVEAHGIYATYKLALGLIARARVGVGGAIEPGSSVEAILNRLFAMQGPEGGWITDYDPELKPRGLANVETTCMAIIALEAGAG